MRYLYACILVFFLTGAVLAQDSNGQKFIKISHNSKQTLAEDSIGGVWYYNNQTDSFEAGRDYRQATRDIVRDDDYGSDEVVLPAEVRCTNIKYGDINELFDEVVIEQDERIEGTVFCTKDITVYGLVTKDVVSLRTVTIASTGEVRGEVIAKNIRRERGGKIHGSRQEINFPDVLSLDIPRIDNLIGSQIQFFMIIIVTFLAVIMASLIPKPLGRIVNKLSNNIMASFFWGLFFWVALIPILILLIITIIGIPLIIVYVLLIPLTILLGLAAVSQAVGEKVCQKINWQKKSLYLRITCGGFTLSLIYILGLFLNIVGLESLAMLFFVVFCVVGFVALTTGIGSVISSKFGMKPKPQQPQYAANTPPSSA